jgi:hypothetical protein
MTPSPIFREKPSGSRSAACIWAQPWAQEISLFTLAGLTPPTIEAQSRRKRGLHAGAPDLAQGYFSGDFF